MPSPAVFFDRDGVLIENRDQYVRDWDEVEYLPGAFEACQRLKTSPYLTVVVTNQAVVGRGILTLEHVEALNRRILHRFSEEGAPFAGAYMCPHKPEDECDCRKPLPGMLLQAARDLDLDLSASFLVGDALTDMQAAKAAGAQGILVRTGRGEGQAALMTKEDKAEWPVVRDIARAVDRILR